MSFLFGVDTARVCCGLIEIFVYIAGCEGSAMNMADTNQHRKTHNATSEPPTK
jgi:hypothetical protein